MVSVLAMIQKQGGRFAHIERHDVDTAVIVDVAKGCASTGTERNIAQAGGRGDLLKRAIPLVAKQQHRLTEVGGIGNRVHLRINMAIRREDV